jgi:hypothetical protein
MTAEAQPQVAAPSGASWSPDLKWVLDALWGRSEGVIVARPGELGGRRAVEGFAVLPSARRPRLLVPLGSGPAAAQAVRDHPTDKRLLRLAKPMIASGMRLRFGRRLVHDRLGISVAAGETRGPLPELLLKEHLKEVLGRRDIETAVKFDAPRPHRKPTIQVLSREGEVLAYAKVGWNELTRELVKAEAEALGMLMRPRLRHLEVPQVLHAGRWRGLELLVVAPLAIARQRRGRSLLTTPPLAATREVASLFETARGPLGASDWWTRLRRRLSLTEEALGERSGLRELAEQIERKWGDQELRYGFWHGDWVPSNMSARGTALSVWDWERAGPLAPFGLDAVHFEYQVALTNGGSSPLATACEFLARPSSSLGELRLPESLRPLFVALHLFEMALRFEEARAAGVDTVDGKYRRPLETLLSSMV